MGKTAKKIVALPQEYTAMVPFIIFDIDGTLIDTERTGVLSLIQTVKELMGKEMPYDEAYKYFGIPSGKVAPMMGYPDAKLFERRWEEHFIGLMHLMKAFPGVEEMMERLAQAGCRMGCAFCASTLNGLEYNLLAGEILSLNRSRRRCRSWRPSGIFR